jgi:GWxTD domain-containing protein
LIAASATLASQPIDFVADVVQFRGNAGSTNWEFHYAFADTTLTYEIRPNGFAGELYCRLSIVGTKADTTVEEWVSAASSASSDPEHDHYLTGSRSIKLSSGKYQVSLFVQDLHDTSRVLTSSFPTTVRTFGLQTEISDIMFTLPALQAQGDAFTRNGVDAVPNPRHEMIGLDPAISIYGEIYNARLNDLDTFVVEYKIFDNVKREMFTTYSKMLGASDGLVFREDIPAGLLRSGVYSLLVTMKSEDLATTYTRTEEKFYILNPDLPPQGQIMLTEELRFLSSEWAVKEDEALAHELELSKVIATKAEKITVEGLNSSRAKQRYLYKFWAIRDPEAETKVNERLEEFREMYQRAQSFYSSAMTRDGWKTDRGITLLRYNRPNQVEQFIQTMNTKPYEIWFYQNIQGGVRFYFVDWQVMQNHKLVHSEMIGEIRDENWFNNYAKAFSPDPTPTESLLPKSR